MAYYKICTPNGEASYGWTDDPDVVDAYMDVCDYELRHEEYEAWVEEVVEEDEIEQAAEHDDVLVFTIDSTAEELRATLTAMKRDDAKQARRSARELARE